MSSKTVSATIVRIGTFVQEGSTFPTAVILYQDKDEQDGGLHLLCVEPALFARKGFAALLSVTKPGDTVTLTLDTRGFRDVLMHIVNTSTEMGANAGTLYFQGQQFL